MTEEDLSYLTSLEAADNELFSIVVDYTERCQGLVGKATLIGLRLERGHVLIEAIKKHERVFRYLLGQSVEPIAHPAEAVLVGIMGGGAG
jgi:hypothetical protein